MKEQNPSQSKAQFTRRSFLKSTSTAIVGGAMLGALPIERLAAQAVDSASEAGSNLSQAVLSADKSLANSQRLLKGWEYRRGNLGSVWEAWRKASEDNVTWQMVELPHCFNAYDAVDPDTAYYQGPGWYRMRLKIENPYVQGRTLLHFEGAGQKSEVYVYTEKVGAHVGGYDEFTVDITDAAAKALKYPENKGLVPVAVMCDNSRDVEMIPSNLSDFNLYGGLYRYVNLVYVPSISIERVHIETSVDAKSKVATAIIRARLYNPAKLKDEVQISVEVLDPQGRVVQTRD